MIKVNNFNDVAKDSLDQWIYYFKNNEIKDNFNAKGINKAKELWRVDNLPEDERNKYLKHIEDLHYSASMAWTMKVDDEDKIRMDEKIKLAKGLKEKSIDSNIISELTGLSKDD